jgi:hypothetical protein
VKTSEAGTSSDGSGGGVPGGTWAMSASSSGVTSAVVTYPVASTNAANWALVTSVASIQKPSTRTRWGGNSSERESSKSPPIVNSPPGIHTMPARASALAGLASPAVTAPPGTRPGGTAPNRGGAVEQQVAPDSGAWEDATETSTAAQAATALQRRRARETPVNAHPSLGGMRH